MLNFVRVVIILNWHMLLISIHHLSTTVTLFIYVVNHCVKIDLIRCFLMSVFDFKWKRVCVSCVQEVIQSIDSIHVMEKKTQRHFY